jgi:hypothetical protein
VFGNVTYVSVLQQYGPNPSLDQIGNLAASTVNAGGNPFRIDWTGVNLTQQMIQTFAQVLEQLSPASKGFSAPTAYVRMVGLPQWATEWLAQNTGYVRE